RSALVGERTPPSIQCRPPILIGGHTLGVAQLAATASTSPAPLAASKTVNSPDPASTAVICRRRAGHSRAGSLPALVPSRWASGIVFAASAILPSRARTFTGSLELAAASHHRAARRTPVRGTGSARGGASCAS